MTWCFGMRTFRYPVRRRFLPKDEMLIPRGFVIVKESAAKCQGGAEERDGSAPGMRGLDLARPSRPPAAIQLPLPPSPFGFTAPATVLAAFAVSSFACSSASFVACAC